MKFKECLLEDITREVFSGGTPNTKVSTYWNGSLSWLSSGETRRRIIRYTEKKITGLGAEKSSTKLAKKGDIVIASAGQGNTRGQVSILAIDTYINQSIISIRPDSKIVNNYYLYYNLLSRYSELRAISDASSIRGSITTKMLKGLNIKLPELLQQKKIGNILWKIDSKIELNNQIINTLEETATTLFNHWIIDFEFPDENGNPYKSSGGKMIESELGEIPEGWEVKNLGDLVTFEYGKALKKENRLNGKYPVYGSGGVVGYHNEYLINGPSIIVGRKGTVGSIYYSEENSFPIDTTFWIKPKLENLSMGFTLLILKNQDFSNLISDSAVPGLNRNVAYQNKVIFPAEKIMLEFNAINDSLLKNINSLKKESETLKELRDTLLPKLLSGEIELE